MSCDVLLVHVPAPPGSYPRINLMAMGLFSMADYLSRRSVPTRIVHAGLRSLSDPFFSLEELVEQQAPRLMGFSLQWHQQGRSTLSAVSALKARFPHLPTVLGGMTASVLGELLMEHCPFVDFVVQGEGEIPLYELSSSIISGNEGDLGGVPNLIWRRGDRSPIVNSQTYAADPAVSADLCFTNFQLMSGADKYLRLRMNSEGLTEDRTFYFSPGRGCKAECAACGGAFSAFASFHRRCQLLWFDLDRVIAELRAAADNGVTRWNCCFDPDPDGLYYLELFRRIRLAGLKLNCHFDCFGLPSLPFIREFRDTFVGESALNISAETGSETHRKKLKTFWFSNAELLNRLSTIQACGLKFSLYFSHSDENGLGEGLPETRQLIERVKNSFPDCLIFDQSVERDPGSPGWTRKDSETLLKRCLP